MIHEKYSRFIAWNVKLKCAQYILDKIPIFLEMVTLIRLEIDNWVQFLGTLIISNTNKSCSKSHINPINELSAILLGEPGVRIQNKCDLFLFIFLLKLLYRFENITW
jgi:hypothetical protein